MAFTVVCLLPLCVAETLRHEPTSHSVAAQGSPSLMLQRFHCILRSVKLAIKLCCTSCTDSITPLHSLALARLRALSDKHAFQIPFISADQFALSKARTSFGTRHAVGRAIFFMAPSNKWGYALRVRATRAVWAYSTAAAQSTQHSAHNT